MLIFAGLSLLRIPSQSTPDNVGQNLTFSVKAS
jgi:hypothetical protein